MPDNVMLERWKEAWEELRTWKDLSVADWAGTVVFLVLGATVIGIARLVTHL